MPASFDATRRHPFPLTHESAPSQLRLLLGFDAATCVLLGALLVAANAAVARITGLPPALLVDAGWLLLAFGAVVAWSALRRMTPRLVVLAIVDANLAWAIASVAFGVFGGATAIGRTAVVAQGLAVAVLAVAEFALWRRTFRPAARADAR